MKNLSILWWIGVVMIMLIAWKNAQEVRTTVERWSCAYKLGGECVSQDAYFKAVAYDQAQEALADLELFCSYSMNRSSPRCSFFFQH